MIKLDVVKVEVRSYYFNLPNEPLKESDFTINTDYLLKVQSRVNNGNTYELYDLTCDKDFPMIMCEIDNEWNFNLGHVVSFVYDEWDGVILLYNGTECDFE